MANLNLTELMEKPQAAPQTADGPKRGSRLSAFRAFWAPTYSFVKGKLPAATSVVERKAAAHALTRLIARQPKPAGDRLKAAVAEAAAGPGKYTFRNSELVLTRHAERCSQFFEDTNNGVAAATLLDESPVATTTSVGPLAWCLFERLEKDESLKKHFLDAVLDESGVFLYFADTLESAGAVKKLVGGIGQVVDVCQPGDRLSEAHVSTVYVLQLIPAATMAEAIEKEFPNLAMKEGDTSKLAGLIGNVMTDFGELVREVGGAGAGDDDLGGDDMGDDESDNMDNADDDMGDDQPEDMTGDATDDNADDMGDDNTGDEENFGEAVDDKSGDDDGCDDDASDDESDDSNDPQESADSPEQSQLTVAPEPAGSAVAPPSNEPGSLPGGALLVKYLGDGKVNMNGQVATVANPQLIPLDVVAGELVAVNYQDGALVFIPYFTHPG